ncbi:MAG: hypothetical protein UY01_C0003G0022 [Candidatus Nomurabacteria bacterium GW2011_GWB1_47_6]|uniref:Uncharacterized protein n=1 Tax=Candidatus Nomurabacteria bacterium GW2011_GWB1_47_6 TaxID=1618749 RepID=A0A0G1T256_9BACT|nr:MAG: hypothetical protein UY01_C0003G0022 [Candidatus Nomurabacteria bacterium GW2011_GWB1_47_6]
MFNRLVVVVILALAVLISTTAIAEDSLDGNVKILVHGVNGSGPVVLSGWLIGVNLAQDPSKWFVAIGLQFNGENGWLGVHAGMLIADKQVIFVPEIRGAYNGEKYSFFTNIQWIDPGNSTQGAYLFLQGNRAIVKGIRLGLEAENTWKHEVEVRILATGPQWVRTSAAGPQLVFNFGEKMTCVASYQFVNEGKPHVWVRMAFSF